MGLACLIGHHTATPCCSCTLLVSLAASPARSQSLSCTHAALCSKSWAPRCSRAPLQDKDGNTPLHAAVRVAALQGPEGNDSCVRALLTPGQGWDVPTLVKVGVCMRAHVRAPMCAAHAQLRQGYATPDGDEDVLGC